MKPVFLIALIAQGVLLGSAGLSLAREFHVSVTGSDTNRGNKGAPFRTIQRAAQTAQPGDVITVHQGTYRERINPPRGGTSDKQRITYQAGLGERVEIKGSELITNWVRVQGDVWVAAIPNSVFGAFNPYTNQIHGDWFDGKGRAHHTGAVYLDGDWLIEATTKDEVLSEARSSPPWLVAANLPTASNLWFAEANATTTTIWAQFKGVNPNRQCVEINARQSVFYPDKPGRDYITVRGFRMSQAATPWAPPTAEQIGLVGTHWSKGWIIEDNEVSYSICSGIALGKYGDQWDNTSANTAEGYVKTVERALQFGWSKERVGHHLVRRNTISHCEQAGIVGSLGAVFSTVADNVIHDIHVRKLFTGAEMAGIKFHGAIDTVIVSNRIYRACLGLWLDWMAQGTRVSANCFYQNGRDLFVEVNHGPFIVDNNLFLSPASLLDVSEGGAYVHNLFTGTIVSSPEPSRQTPYHPAHSTQLAGLVSVKGGDCRFYSNLFAKSGGQDSSGFGLAAYDARERPLFTGGNVYYQGSRPYRNESGASLPSNIEPITSLAQVGDQLVLNVRTGPELKRAETRQVTTALLGKCEVSGAMYENPDGSPLKIETDFFGKPRNPRHPTPGPFENGLPSPLRFGLQ